jgi:hypothetical protein
MKFQNIHKIAAFKFFYLLNIKEHNQSLEPVTKMSFEREC